jgi:hypothetical protein
VLWLRSMDQTMTQSEQSLVTLGVFTEMIFERQKIKGVILTLFKIGLSLLYKIIACETI